jgi:hypothetical protein
MSRSQGRLGIASKGIRGVDFLDGNLTEEALIRLFSHMNQWVRSHFLLDGYLTGVLRTQGRVR